MSKSKFYIIVYIVVKSLKTVLYIMLRGLFKSQVFLIINFFFDKAIIIFVYTILIIKENNIKFWLYCLLN